MKKVANQTSDKAWVIYLIQPSLAVIITDSVLTGDIPDSPVLAGDIPGNLVLAEGNTMVEAVTNISLKLQIQYNIWYCNISLRIQ